MKRGERLRIRAVRLVLWARRRQRRLGARVRYLARVVAPLVLPVGGLGLLAAAAFTISTTLGLAAAGVAALLLHWQAEGPPPGEP